MDVIKRFNVIIDYGHYDMYLRPNGLVTLPYHRASFVMPIIICVAGLIVIAIGVYSYRYARKKWKEIKAA